MADTSLEPTSPATTHRGPKAWLRHLIFGFIMGSADVVPGVSGGTVAFVVGIYHRLVAAISGCAGIVGLVFQRRFREVLPAIRALDFGLFVPLLVGIALAVLTLASIIETGLEDYPEQMASLFMGLVLGSVVVAWSMVRKPNAKAMLLALLAAIAFYLFLGLTTDTHPDEDAVAATRPLWAYFGAGAIAICAMILPGISGSFLLVIMGMYSSILAAVNDRDLLPVLVFVAGCAIGILAFSRLLSYVLRRFHDIVVALMIGLMLGSVRILWPWPDGTNSTAIGSPSDNLVIGIILAIIGFVIVIVIARLGALKEERVPAE